MSLDTEYIIVCSEAFKCLWHENFLGKYSAYHMYKPIPKEEKFQKT